MAFSADEAKRFFTVGGKRLATGGSGTPLSSPDDEELSRFNRLRDETYSEYMNWLEVDDAYYRGHYGQNILPKEWRDEGFTAVVPQTAYDAVETNANHILTTPDIFVPPRPSMTDAIEEDVLAGQKGEALEFFWNSVAGQHGNPMRQAAKKLVKEGRVVFKKTIRWDRVNADGLNFGQRGFMWDVKALANDTVYADPDNPEDPRYVYEAYEIRVGHATRLFPRSEQTTGDDTWRENKKDLDTVRFVEMWTKPEGSNRGGRQIWIDNELVLKSDTPYSWVIGVDENGKDIWDGYLPYTIRASGWGDQDSEANPADLYVGVIRYMHSMLDAEARELTAADAQLRIATFPPIKRWGVDPKNSNFEFGPAKVWDFDGAPGEADVQAFAFPPLDSSVWTLLNRLHGSMNEASKAGTLGGSSQRGVDTATEADLNVRNASSKLTGPVDALASAITEMSRQFFMDIEHVMEAPVALFGAGLTGTGAVLIHPHNIDGFYEVFVELKTTDQAALDRSNMRLWADIKNEFAVDQAYAMRKAGIKNPMERIMARAEEDIFLSPELGQERIMLALAGSSGDGQFIRETMRLAMAQGQSAGAEGNAGFQPGQADLTGASGGNAIADVAANANQRAQVEQQARQFA